MTITEGASPPTDRVVRIVGVLAANPDRSYGLSELARAAGITTATCHAILASLAAAGWVTRSDRAYGLGPGLLAIGRAAATGYPVARAAAAELAELAAATGMPATTSVLAGDTITIVDAAGPGAAELIGRTIAYAPPIGMVFAAWGDTEAWLARVPKPEATDLRRAAGEARARGYVIERFTPAFSRLRGILAELAQEGEGRLEGAVLGLLAELGFAEYFANHPREGERVDVTVLGAPVLHCGVAANLSIHPRREMAAAELSEAATRLTRAAGRVSRQIEG